MLSLHNIRDDRNNLLEALAKRGKDFTAIIDQVITLDDERRNVQTNKDAFLAQINAKSKEIGQLFRDGKTEEANEAKSSVNSLKDQSSGLEAREKDLIKNIEDLLLQVPNAPHPSVPAGQTEEDNEIVKDWDQDLPELGEDALPHWELGDQYELMDFEAGAQITGSGFVVYKGRGARLERALINFFLDQAGTAGYTEVMPPLLVNEATALATGNLPDKEGQMYHCEKDDLYLIPTAEVPLTNLYRNVILKEDQLPAKITGYTPCFRREAGSYGADVKGLNRMHQFNKVEIVQVVHPDQSYQVLEEMVAHVESLLAKLELPYRILRLCGGDLGFTSALTYDFEVYSAAQKRWLEVSSVSNFETFQTNRLKLRFKDKNGKNRIAHTLNGSALALARIVASLLENHQTPEGIRIPAALQPYTGFKIIS